MANPDAIMRASKMPPMPNEPPGGPSPAKPMGGMPQEGPQGAPSPSPGLDGIVQSLEGVGAFLQAQAGQGNPKAEEAMSAFRALLSSMQAMGGEGEGDRPPVDLESGPGPAPGAIPMGKAPGVKVL